MAYQRLNNGMAESKKKWRRRRNGAQSNKHNVMENESWRKNGNNITKLTAKKAKISEINEK